MSKRHRAKYIFMTLGLLLALISSCGTALAATGFKDVTDGHWAVRYISRMNALKIVGGYPDGAFRPDQAVTELEAVIMAVRCQGGGAGYTATVPFTVPKWAEQDVARAVGLGLLKSSDEFYPEAAATRAWVTRLLVRMIGKEGEASNNLDRPTFTDSYLIPAWATGYVQVAQASKLVGGYPDNTFRPDAAVTRAEMAAFLGRVQDRAPEATPLINGRVVEVSLSQLTISTAGGEKRTFQVAFDVPAYDEGGPISLLALQPSDRVALVADGDQIKYLEKLAAEPISAVVNGSILTVYPEKRTLVVEVTGGEYRTLYLPPDGDPVISGAGGPGLAALQPGDEVEITLNAANYVTGITVISRTQGSITEGVVYDLKPDALLITLQGDGGSLASYRLAEPVHVIVAGQRFPTVKDIRAGDRVRVTVEDHAVTTIEVLEVSSRLDVSGTVVAVVPASGALTLEVDGQFQAFRVAETATITIPGLVRATLADVANGDQVQAHVEKGEITRLEIKGRQVEDKLTGTVVSVDTGNRMLTLKDEKQAYQVYKIKDNARIVIDGEDGTLSDIKKDMRASLRLVDKEVIFLEVDNTRAGTVVSLDESGLLLVLQDQDGRRETYVIGKNAAVESRDGRDELDEIRRGDYAEITLDDDTVTGIKLRTELTLRVEDIRTEWDRIDAEDEDGDTYRLYIRDGVDLVVPGVDFPDVKDVLEGATVRATYLGDDLARVEVLQPQRGQVTAVNTGARTVTLARYDGTTATLDFHEGSEIIAGGRKYSSLSQLVIGNRVEAVENVKGGYTFKVMQQVTGTLVADVDVYLLPEDGLVLLPAATPWRQESYDVAQDVYVHASSGSITPASLKKGGQVRLYLLNDVVYEIEVI
ncbi:MAG: hypothetical protein PWQ18_725 [Clostridia bacterium]|nr:hypothetical protein [Clostridia bacterium]